MFIPSRDSSRIGEQGDEGMGEEGGMGSVGDDGYIIETCRIVSFFSDDDVVYIVGSSDAGYRMPVLGE